VRRRLAAAEDALAEALAEMKRAEEALDASNDRFAAAVSVLDVAREERAAARRERSAARQAHERASTVVARLQRRVAEMAERIGRMSGLAACLTWRRTRVLIVSWACSGLPGGAIRSDAPTDTSGALAWSWCRGSGATAPRPARHIRRARRGGI
jgi:hypothetical protein